MTREAAIADGRTGWWAQRLKKKTSFAMERQGVVGLLFTSPVLIILLLLLAYPFILGIWLSFTDTIIGRTGRFIALENYFYLLSDDVFLLTTFNTVLYTFVAVFFKLVFGFALAVVLNRDFKGKGFVRAIVLLPWIVPTALSTIVFWWLFDSQFSCLSWLLMKIGLISTPSIFSEIPTMRGQASASQSTCGEGSPFSPSVSWRVCKPSTEPLRGCRHRRGRSVGQVQEHHAAADHAAAGRDHHIFHHLDIRRLPPHLDHDPGRPGQRHPHLRHPLLSASHPRRPPGGGCGHFHLHLPHSADMRSDHSEIPEEGGLRWLSGLQKNG